MTSTSQTSSSSASSNLTFESAFSKPIPLLVGKVVTLGIPFWASAKTLTKTTTTINTTVTAGTYTFNSSSATIVANSPSFAVAFGKPDPQADHTYISRIWINSILSYDATGKSPVTLGGLTITCYDGSEDQLADPLIQANVGTYTPAFRGLVYAVIQGVDFATLSALPQIVAEVVQTSDTSYNVYTPVGTPDANYLMNLFDPSLDQATMFFSTGYDVFSIDDQLLEYSMPCTGPNGESPYQVIGGFGNLMRMTSDRAGYVAQGPTGLLSYVDLATNTVKSQVLGSPSGTLASGRGAGQYREFIVMDAQQEGAHGGPLRSFGLKGDTLYRISGNDGLTPNVGNWTCVTPGFAGKTNPNLINHAFFFRTLNTTTLGAALDQQDLTNPFTTGQKTVRPVIGADVTNVLGGGTSDELAFPNNEDITAIKSPTGVYFFQLQTGSLGDVPAYVVHLKTVAALEAYFTPLDTSKFSVFWAVKDGNKLYRVILCDGQNVPFAQTPSLIGRTQVWRRGLGGFNNTFGYWDDNANAGAQSGGSAGTQDPERGLAAPYYGRHFMILNEPQIQAMTGGDRVDLMYTAGSGETIAKVICGGEANAFVSLIVLKADGTMVLRRFDTVWNRKLSDTPLTEWDNNYYTYNQDGSPINNATTASLAANAQVSLVNPPMYDATHLYFSPYADVAIPFFETSSLYPAGVTGMNALKDTLYSTDGSVFSYGSKGSLVVLDAYAGTYTEKGSAGFKDAATGATLPSPIVDTSTYDITTGLIYSATSPTNFYLNAGVPADTITMGAALTSLCLFAGYTKDQVNVGELATIAIEGVNINETTGFASLLAQFAQAFSIDIFDTNDQINFVRKKRGASLAYDVSLTTDDLSSVDEGTDPNKMVLINYERAYVGDLPTVQTIEYIDSDNFGTVGTQVAKRTKFPIRTTAADQTADVSVPVFMSASDAIYWANACLFDAWAAGTQLNFRVGPEGIPIEPGDYAAISHADGSVDPVRVIKTTLNADMTVSLIGTSLIQFNDFAGAGSQSSFVQAQQLVKLNPPVPAVFDNVLFSIADDSDPTTIPVRYTADVKSGLYIYNGGYKLAGSITSPAIVGKLLTKLPVATPTGSVCVYETDRKTQLRVRFGGKVALGSVTDADFLAGKNIALCGATGRWEVIYFQNATANTDGTYTLTNLMRGRRGTEANAVASKVTDVIAILTTTPSLIALPLATKGTGVSLKVAVAGTAGSTSTALSISPGASKQPWAPANVRGSLVASTTQAGRSEIVLTWNQRTRDEADTLHDGDGTVANDFGDNYAVAIQAASTGNTIRVVTCTAQTMTYTAEQQIADGFTSQPASLLVSVTQTSAIVGAGIPAQILLTF